MEKSNVFNVYVMKDCPYCKMVEDKVKKLGLEDKFEFIDIKSGYYGYVPDQVPVLQDFDTVGTLQAENIMALLTKLYGESEE